MSEEYQGELFGEFKGKDSSLKRFSKKILPNRKAHIVQIPLEHLISYAILILIGFVLFFALGVEKGKRASQKKPEIVQILSVADNKISNVMPEAPIETAEKNQITEKPYTIQLISYADEKIAMEKIKSLKKDGIDAFTVKSGKWYQVCANYYTNKNEADNDLKKFGKTYKGCFLRNITQ